DHDGKIDVTYGLHFTGGDSMSPYLVLGSGPGMKIDYLAARSAKGEWLAVVRSDKLELIEAATYRRWVLSDVDITYDNWWMRDHNARFASIAANATRMTYLRKANGRDIIVIRDLPSGVEREVAIADKLWRATVDESGRWAGVTVIRADTDGDGKIDWPGGVGWGLGGCGSDIIHHRDPTGGDQVTELWLDLASGQLVEDPTVLGVVGDDLLRRRTDGALLLGTTVIAEASCEAKVKGVIASPPRVIVTCAADSKPTPGGFTEAPAVIVGRGFHKRTRRLEFRDRDDSVYPHERFALISDSSTTTDTYVDFVTGDEIAVATSYVYDHEQYVVMHNGNAWAVFDLLTRTQTALGATGTLGNTSDTLVDIGSSRFDLRTGKRIGPVTDDVILVDSRGRVLRGPRIHAQANHYSPGPLRWAP
ncbi:MAG TPA: hypothetical protein VFK02_06970, partial [Kofleriaceae bacterium]|nr:hypothetical protein [Kofleriaceae bacterium]